MENLKEIMSEIVFIFSILSFIVFGTRFILFLCRRFIDCSFNEEKPPKDGQLHLKDLYKGGVNK